MTHETKRTPGQWTALVRAAVEKGAAHPAYKENLLKEARVADTSLELLEALEGVEEWIMNHVPDCAGRDYHLSNVRAAIAKAKG
jgi:hypothetical protein